ncbi:MAG: 30S ribosomal protein S17 [Nanoarchaeota archaeon]
MAKEIKQTSLDLNDVRTHGRSFVGTVISDKMNATVTVEWKWRVYIPKYERYMVKTSKVKAHNPDAIDAKEGDTVRIVQCRPISKTKHFIVTEKIADKVEE